MGTIHTNFRISTAEAGARDQLAPLTTWKDRTALLGLALVLWLCACWSSLRGMAAFGRRRKFDSGS